MATIEAPGTSPDAAHQPQDEHSGSVDFAVTAPDAGPVQLVEVKPLGKERKRRRGGRVWIAVGGLTAAAAAGAVPTHVYGLAKPGHVEYPAVYTTNGPQPRPTASAVASGGNVLVQPTGPKQGPAPDFCRALSGLTLQGTTVEPGCVTAPPDAYAIVTYDLPNGGQMSITVGKAAPYENVGGVQVGNGTYDQFAALAGTGNEFRTASGRADYTDDRTKGEAE